MLKVELNGVQKALYHLKQDQGRKDKEHIDFLENAQNTADLNLEAQPLEDIRIRPNYNHVKRGPFDRTLHILSPSS